LDLEKVIYIVFDIETTGFSRQRNSIIEIAAQLIDPNGNQIIDAKFSSLVKPVDCISPLITSITGITNKDVENADNFEDVGNDFLRFLVDDITEWEVDNNQQILDIVFVAHNGRVFDVPFLIEHFRRFKIDYFFEFCFNRMYLIDTLELSKHVTKGSKSKPDNYKLGTIYNHITQKTFVGHRAEEDVKATVDVFLSKHYWMKRKEVIHKILEDGVVVPYRDKILSPNDDSDTDDEDSKESAVSNEDDSVDNIGVEEVLPTNLEDRFLVSTNDPSQSQELIPEQILMGWEKNVGFDGVNVDELFAAAMEDNDARTRLRRESQNKTGVRCSVNSVNSPVKAWRHIFTSNLLEKVTKYTNEYGNAKCSDIYEDIKSSDITDFICVLFIASVQKRKDKPKNWFSSDIMLENLVMKRIMSGRKFLMILRFLHVCSLVNQPLPSDPGYSPIYKIKEFQDYLETRFTSSFIPGQYLSLDESLVRAFGRIKFKVRIVTKSARYGIKMYVLTDATTAFVLKVIVYTGAYTYQVCEREDLMKTVKVVVELTKAYQGTHRTIYIDRFYTSLDLMKQLDKVDLYVTGTVMKNRVPKDLVIAKTSQQFKNMNRGDFTKHKYNYVAENGKVISYGLVCWKDRDIVYCLTSNSNTNEVGNCYRRTMNGRVLLERPKVIEEYNMHMGGVDLADQKRLHANSTIMGQNRWWLKLFFYFLDVGTANALVLHNMAMNTNYNIVEFKTKLIKQLMGSRIEPVNQSIHAEHELERTDARMQCVYCGLTNIHKRTRYRCRAPSCQLPLCAVGSGKSKQDCFMLAHSSDRVLEIALQKYNAMKKYNPKSKN
jgi:DNA polymerase III subunit epsilon